ncbi:MAG: hypothetical protein KBB71_13740 [Lentimicrobiaceae bacterium]|jgi:uncharacterized membrane protein|nr:hypothetical protein [Lentimicrobiaceae bacterium]
MKDPRSQPSALRIIAGVILGIVVGFFVFFGIALILGALNISVSMQFAENIFSLIVFVLSMIVCIALVLWLVWTTPPTEPDQEAGSE